MEGTGKIGNDKIVVRGKCAACNTEGDEDNKVYWFDYWKLDMCKNCFIQLTTEQIEALQTWDK